MGYIPLLEEEIPNGSSLIKLNYGIDTNAMQQRRWISADVKTLASSKLFKRFRFEFSLRFNKIARPYRGFPSALHLTRKLSIIFTDEVKIASIHYNPGNYVDMAMSINTRFLTGPIAGYMPISHELYHVIGAMHEGEVEMINEIYKYGLSYRKRAQTYIAEIEGYAQYIEEVLSKLKSGSKIRRDLMQRLFVLLVGDESGGGNLTLFYNKIGDLMVSVIALKLKDYEYILEDLDDADKNASIFIKKINKLFSKLNVESKTFDVYSYVEFIEYCECIWAIPYNLIPFAEYPNTYSRRCKKVLSKFLDQVRKLSPAVQERVFGAYDLWVEVSRAGLRSLDPSEKNLKICVHNPAAMLLSKRLFGKIARDAYYFYQQAVPVQRV